MVNNCYIVASARTPIGNFNGAFASLSAADLGAIAIKEVLKRAQVDGGDVDEVILGQVYTANAGGNPARQAAWKGGIPHSSTAWTLNMLCGSGLKSVGLGFLSISCGAQSIMICGGQESMTNAPHVANLREGKRLCDVTMVDTIMKDGLIDPFYNITMGETAENVAKQYNISRVEQDNLACLSQQLTTRSQKMGSFDSEIVGVPVTKKGVTIVITQDEFPRNDTSTDELAKLRPCFIKQGGTVTAGNSSGINDAAAVVLLMSEQELKRRNAKPLAKIVGYAQAGLNPSIMGMGPALAIKKLLELISWSINDVDLFEINEAFAAMLGAVRKQLNIPQEKVNIHGGSIALGHPLGASGCRVLGSLITTLRKTGKRRGVVSLCVGGGMGVAMAIEIEHD